jgi:hypothetical protein
MSAKTKGEAATSALTFYDLLIEEALKTPGRVTMSELAITPTHLCRCEYAVKGNPPVKITVLSCATGYRVTTISIT